VTRRRQRSARWLLTATVAPLAVLAAVIVAVSYGPGGHGRQGSQAVSARPAVPAQAASKDAAGSFRAQLAGVKWTDFDGVRLPSSPLAGPHHAAGGLARGFSDTPLGALLAAVNIAVRANAQWGPGVFGPTIRGQVTGPDADALLAACQAGYDQAATAAGITGGAPLGNASVAERAFRWVAWSPAQASIDLVSAGPDANGMTVMAVTRVQAAWDGADWKVIAPPGGDWGNTAAPLASLAGYTVFPGQG
jgi:hypothetical protein